MFWEILWALILGFGLSGVVQALISKKEMSRLLLDDSPKNIIRATLSGCDRLPEADLSSPAGPVLAPPMHTWTNIILAALTIASNDLNSINHCEYLRRLQVPLSNFFDSRYRSRSKEVLLSAGAIPFGICAAHSTSEATTAPNENA
jgi:hypothetical protein